MEIFSFKSLWSSFHFVVHLNIFWALVKPLFCLCRWVCGSRTCLCFVSCGPSTSPSRSTRGAATTCLPCPVPTGRTGWRTVILMKMRNIILNPPWHQQKLQMEMTRHLKTGRPRTAGYMTLFISRYKRWTWVAFWIFLKQAVPWF